MQGPGAGQREPGRSDGRWAGKAKEAESGVEAEGGAGYGRPAPTKSPPSRRPVIQTEAPV